MKEEEGRRQITGLRAEWSCCCAGGQDVKAEYYFKSIMVFEEVVKYIWSICAGTQDVKAK